LCGSSTPGLHARHCPLAAVQRGTPAAWVVAGGITRHGCSCSCRICAAVRPAPAPTPVYVDTRPRRDYRLPDGTVFPYILHHGDIAPATITVALKGGAIVTATRVGVASTPTLDDGAGDTTLCTTCSARARWFETGGYEALAAQCRVYCTSGHAPTLATVSAETISPAQIEHLYVTSADPAVVRAAVFAAGFVGSDDERREAAQVLADAWNGGAS
jgi:hypothetical protein